MKIRDRRVLIVDDDRDFADSLAELLVEKGYAAQAAYDDQDAIHLLKSLEAQVVLLDIRLHGKNGLDLISTLKTIQPDLYCILITAHASLDTAIRALHCGAYDYLMKPVPDDVLMKSLDRCFNMIRLQAENRAALQSLRNIELINSAIFESALDSIITIDHEGKVIEFNAAAEKAFGYKRSEIIGREMAELIIPPRLRERHRQGLKNYLRTNRSVMIGHRTETMAMRADHSTFPIEISLVRVPIDGPPIFASYIRDISSKKQAEKEMKRSKERLERALEGTIQAIASTLESRDPYTAGHQRRVANLACAIGEKLGLNESRLKCIRMGATIHDIGKIHVPAEILSKPSQLTTIEYSLVKTHTTVGYDILKAIEFPWMVAEIAHQHHERMDGSGYPQGLKDNEILLEARIVAVADVVEAMSTHRPYRPSKGTKKALKEITDHKGTLYDKDAVNTCLQLFQENDRSVSAYVT
jgi:PAS domain S-box-containing protein/putative nucleotidyltransferase with HDIG domain